MPWIIIFKKKFIKFRKEDINLNIGVAPESGAMSYYMLDSPTLNTFSKEEVENYVTSQWHKLLNRREVKVETVDFILDNFFLKFWEYFEQNDV